MNRRSFLSLVAMGVPATIVAEKAGLIHQVKTYFFAPRRGWIFPDPACLDQLLIEHWAKPLNANAGTWHNLGREIVILPGDIITLMASAESLLPGAEIELSGFRGNQFVTMRRKVKEVDRAQRTITIAS